jgi:WD40 repeat protein
VAFSPDGRLLASGSDDMSIGLWDPTTGMIKQTLEEHSRRVLSLAFSPDSQLLASGSEDKTVRLWDPATGVLRQTFLLDAPVKELRFSRDGSYLRTNSGDLQIQHRCDAPSVSLYTDIKISIDRQWIEVNGEKILWLPPEFRSQCSAVNGNLLALGNVSGRVFFIEFRV